MKKKVGELYDKPIVIGNPNEFTKNEIALSDLEGDSFDNGTEYYEVLDNTIFSNFTTEDVEAMIYSHGHRFVSSSIRLSDGTFEFQGKSFLDSDCIAFETTNKYGFDIRDGGTKKQLLEEALNKIDASLNDTSKFKRITAKEYYSLID